jgi:DNA-binding NtrC family response regulator
MGRTVLVVIEDRALSDVLAEALVEAGHDIAQVDDAAAAERAVALRRFDAAIVDLDTRARQGAGLVAHLAATQPQLTVIALLPCGGLPASARPPLYHFALEKPARIAALLSAVNIAHAAIRN